MVPTDLGKRTGRTVNVAVMNMAVPTPSTILSRIQNVMKTRPGESMSTKL